MERHSTMQRTHRESNDTTVPGHDGDDDDGDGDAGDAPERARAE